MFSKTVTNFGLLMSKYLCLLQNWRLKINVDLQLIKDSQRVGFEGEEPNLASQIFDPKCLKCKVGNLATDMVG